MGSTAQGRASLAAFGTSRTFRINSVDRLIGSTNSFTGEVKEYWLDAATNVHEEVSIGSFGTFTTFNSFNNMNSLTSSSGQFFTYDARGSRTNSGAFQYDYDHAARVANMMQGTFDQLKNGFYEDSRAAYTITPALQGESTLVHVWADGQIVQDWEIPSAAAVPVMPTVDATIVFVFDMPVWADSDRQGMDANVFKLAGPRGVGSTTFPSAVVESTFAYADNGLTITSAYVEPVHAFQSLRLLMNTSSLPDMRGGLLDPIERRENVRRAPHGSFTCQYCGQASLDPLELGDFYNDEPNSLANSERDSAVARVLRRRSGEYLYEPEDGVRRSLTAGYGRDAFEYDSAPLFGYDRDTFGEEQRKLASTEIYENLDNLLGEAGNRYDATSPAFHSDKMYAQLGRVLEEVQGPRTEQPETFPGLAASVHAVLCAESLIPFDQHLKPAASIGESCFLDPSECPTH